MPAIVIDPGHGGTTKVGGSSPNNATGPNGTLEKALTLDVAMRAATVLGDAGDFVWLTRDSDTNLSLSDRAAAGKDRKADVFVSVHFNASTGHNAQGTETLIDVDWSPGSDRLASCIQGKVQSVVGSRDRGVKTRGDLGILHPEQHLSTTAVALVEVSFLDREDEEARLQGDAYKQRIANAIAEGIQLYLHSPDEWGTPAYEPARSFWSRVKGWFRSREAGDL